MKALVIIIFIEIFSLAVNAQKCDDCPRSRVAFYDCDIQTAFPNDVDKSRWNNLFWAALTANDLLIDNCKTNECIQIKDMTVIRAADIQADILKLGRENANRVPEDANYSTDYLFRSIVSGSLGNPTFRLILQAGPSGEVVKSIEIPFANDIENAKSAGKQAALAMIPVYETIKDFEIKKRNSDNDVSIRYYWKKGSPDEITIKPEKNLVKAGETIKVEVKMLDCDGVPLSKRTISFHEISMTINNSAIPVTIKGTSGGLVIPDEATTDESGKVTVQFKAGQTTGTACIKANYPHFAPCGKSALFEGTALVQIDAPPPSLWLLTAEMLEIYMQNSDTTIYIDLADNKVAREYHSIITEETYCKLTAVIENLAEDPKNDFSFNTEYSDPKFIMVSGAGYLDEFVKNFEKLNGDLMNADVRSDNVSGNASPDAGFQIDYSTDYKYFGITIPIKAFGAYHGHRYGIQENKTEWYDYGGDYDNYPLSAGGGGCDPNEPKQVCWLTKKGLEYTGHVSIYEKDQISTPEGMQFNFNKGYVSITLIPYNANTLTDSQSKK